MRYIFRILILGSPELALPYITSALQDEGEDKGSYMEWFKEIAVLQNKCDLEINVITDLTADFDEIIPSVDGIIYFLDPLEKGEIDLFNMTYEIIENVRHEIPTILFYYPKRGILSLSTIDLLKATWIKYPDLEAYVNHPPYQFHQTLQCLSSAMISGDSPLNLENAWFRFPVYVSLINDFYNNAKYYEAAKAAKKAALIAELFERDDYYIISEQAAYLYSKLNLFLEASKILQNIDEIAANNFKKLYVESMIREGNRLFNEKKYEMAAKQYENAAQWASIELKDRNLIVNSFKHAINSWISSLKFNKAFDILERLPHDDIDPTLIEISNKVIAAADYLISEEKLKKAREQLYISINTFQGRGLFDPLKNFINKLLDVLILIIKNEIDSENSNIYYIKETYDEIENLWETFDIKKRDLDPLLADIIKLFLQKYNFGEATELMNRINSLKLKKELTEYSSEKEEEYNKSLKQAKNRIISRGIEFIREFSNAEKEIITEMNKEKIEKANWYIDHDKDYIKASEIMMSQANYLLQMNKDSVADQMIGINLDNLIEGKQFKEFFNVFSKLSNRKSKKRYLSRTFQIYLQKLKEFKEETEQFLKIRWVFEKSIEIFRDFMLYKKSKSIGEIYLDLIHNEALKTSKTERTKEGIEKTVALIKKAKYISDSYLEHEKISFDDVHKNLAEICIALCDLSMALAYNDKIEEKKLKKQVHQKIEIQEKQRNETISEQIEESLKKERLNEKLSIIKKQARDARHDKQNGLKQRKGLKRVYFKEALNHLENDEYKQALEIYKKTIDKLIDVRKYDLAGVSLAVISLLLLKLDQMEEIEEYYKAEIKDNSFFSKTFPIKLVEYVSALNKINEISNLNKALNYYENLPLFKEEIALLYDLLGEKFEKIEEKASETKYSREKLSNLRSEIEPLAKAIENTKSDKSKRKLMKGKYFKSPLERINQNQFLEASIYYLDSVPNLIDKKMYKQAAISLILGIIILHFKKKFEIAKSTYNKKLESDKDAMEKLPEIQFMNKYLNLLESGNKLATNFGLSLLQESLILFEEEKEMLEQFQYPIEGAGEIEQEVFGDKSRELAQKNEELDQLFAKLKHKFRDIKGDKDLLNKRKALKRRYFDEILDNLEEAKYGSAASKYNAYSYRFSKRKDYQLSTLLLLLYVLCSLKSDKTINMIEKNIEEYLNSLGMSKKLVKETYFLLLIRFLLDALQYGIYISHKDELLSMVDDLPLFEIEKKMFKTIS